MVIVLLDDRLVVAHAIVLVDHGRVLGFDHCGNRHAGNRRGSDRENEFAQGVLLRKSRLSNSMHRRPRVPAKSAERNGKRRVCEFRNSSLRASRLCVGECLQPLGQLLELP